MADSEEEAGGVGVVVGAAAKENGDFAGSSGFFSSFFSSDLGFSSSSSFLLTVPNPIGLAVPKLEKADLGFSSPPSSFFGVEALAKEPKPPPPLGLEKDPNPPPDVVLDPKVVLGFGKAGVEVLEEPNEKPAGGLGAENGDGDEGFDSSAFFSGSSFSSLAGVAGF